MKKRNCICVICGKSFSPKIRSRGRSQYCSRKCAGAARQLPGANCLYCHAPFKRRNRTQKYCSVHCANEAARATSYRAAGRAAKKTTRQTGGFALFDDPWANGCIPPDRYGNDYRMPDFGLGF